MQQETLLLVRVGNNDAKTDQEAKAAIKKNLGRTG